MFIKSIPYKVFSKLADFFDPQPKNLSSMWSGDYSSWEEAEKLCSGYDSDDILQKCGESILKVKYGQAVYERDSFLYDEIQYSWALLAGLQKAALEFGGKLNVLDFGGSLGSTYYQNRGFLNSLKELHWNVIEQPNFVKFGQEKIQDDKLKFYYSIQECLVENKPNVILLSGVLQYLKDPYNWWRECIDLNIPYIIVDRTAFNLSGRQVLVIQNVPNEIYKASYPTWFFNLDEFQQYFEDSYSIVATFESSFENTVSVSNDLCAAWKGFILKKK